MNYIDVKNFRKYEQLFGDNGPAKIGHVNAVIKALNEIAANSGSGGTNYIYVMANGTPTENATELLTAYTTAQGMAPSSTNRITIVAGPGYYDLGATTLDMDTPYIDLVSLDGNRSILLSSTNPFGTLWVTANNVFVLGVDTTINNPNKSLSVGSNLPATIIKNCKGGLASFGFGGTISGTFIDCEAGFGSFGAMAFMGAPAGTLDNGIPIVLSGKFINCVSTGDQSFGFATMFPVVVSGTFTNCSAFNSSFGASYGGAVTASGTFTDCVGGNGCFGTSFNNFTASGVFRNCIALNDSLGGGGLGIASGTFTNCSAGSGSYGTASAVAPISNGYYFYCRITLGPWGSIAGQAVYCTEEVLGTNQPFNSGFTPQNNV